MITEITAWVKGIVLVVMFATFLEFLLPVSSMQKFVRVIMGLFIMLSILNPIIDILQKQWLPEQITVFKAYDEKAVPIREAVNRAAENREEVTLARYRSELARQIRAIVVSLDGVAEAKVVVETETAPKGAWQGIASATVYVEPGENRGDKKVTKIAVNSSREQNEKSEIPAQTAQKIRQVITELTGLRKGNIEIKRL